MPSWLPVLTYSLEDSFCNKDEPTTTNQCHWILHHIKSEISLRDDWIHRKLLQRFSRALLHAIWTCYRRNLPTYEPIAPLTWWYLMINLRCFWRYVRSSRMSARSGAEDMKALKFILEPQMSSKSPNWIKIFSTLYFVQVWPRKISFKTRCSLD